MQFFDKKSDMMTRSKLNLYPNLLSPSYRYSYNPHLGKIANKQILHSRAILGKEGKYLVLF